MIYKIETDDKREHLTAVKGVDYLLCLWDMDQWLRGEIKYNHNKWTPEQVEALESARDELRSIVDSHGVSLDDLE